MERKILVERTERERDKISNIGSLILIGFIFVIIGLNQVMNLFENLLIENGL